MKREGEREREREREREKHDISAHKDKKQPLVWNNNQQIEPTSFDFSNFPVFFLASSFLPFILFLSSLEIFNRSKSQNLNEKHFF